MDHRKIIELWPSPKELASEIGEKYETVRKWRYRNRIPSDRWMIIVEAAKKRSLRITLESLALKSAA